MCFVSTNPLQDLRDLLTSMYRHPGAWMAIFLIIVAIFLGRGLWNHHVATKPAPAMPAAATLAHREGLVVLTPHYWQRRENSPLTRVALRYRDAQGHDRRLDVLLPVALRQEPRLALNQRVTLLLDERGRKPVFWGMQDGQGHELVSVRDSQAHLPHVRAHHQSALRLDIALGTLSLGVAGLLWWRLGRKRRAATSA